jgi:hypothetical protein
MIEDQAHAAAHSDEVRKRATRGIATNSTAKKRSKAVIANARNSKF